VTVAHRDRHERDRHDDEQGEPERVDANLARLHLSTAPQ
jgi:hypothetical protein